MKVVPLLVLFSLFLAVCGVLLFVFSVRNHDHEHADRLSLLPLEDDLPPEHPRDQPRERDARDDARGETP